MRCDFIDTAGQLQLTAVATTLHLLWKQIIVVAQRAVFTEN